MTPQEEKELEMLFEKLRAYKSLTVEAREYFQAEIDKVVARIKELQGE